MGRRDTTGGIQDGGERGWVGGFAGGGRRVGVGGRGSWMAEAE